MSKVAATPTATPAATAANAQPRIVPDPPAQDSADAQRAKSGSKALLVLGALGVLTTSALLGYRAMNAGEQSTDDAIVEADVVPVAVRVAGSIAALRVRNDAHVKKGDVILELDRAELEARLKQAESELLAAQAQAATADAQQRVIAAGARGGLSTAQAQVSASRAQVSSATAQVETARAQLASADAEAQRAQRDVGQLEQLYLSKAVSRDQLDNARTGDGTAQARVAAARAQLAAAEQARRVAESRVGEAAGTLDSNQPIDAEIAVADGNAQIAHARVGSAEAAVELARLALSYTSVSAPVDGTVSHLDVRQGQLLAANQPIASIVPDASYVVANFKETQVGAMRAGQKVTIEVDAFPGAELHGVVASLAGGTGSRFSLLPPDNASGNFVKVVQRVPVHIDWSPLPSQLELRPGMSVTVTVHTKS